MENLNPLLLVDFYKPHHQDMYPANMTQLYSNFTPRKSRIAGIDSVVVFGIQHFVLEYLIEKFNKNFFCGGRERIKYDSFKKKVIEEYKRHIPIDTTRIEALWDLGFLPIEIKALEEGTLCPIGVPLLTIKISDSKKYGQHAWLVNYLETLISCQIWQPITSATIAYEYRKILNKYAIETTGSTEGVRWQAHDFSMRGISSVESATLSGMGHLLSFTGTDVIPAIYQLESSYDGNGLIGASVPATEHSVMCMGTKESEIETFQRLLNTYPKDTLSIVSDTWDLWEVVGPNGHLAKLKEQILARDGKLVIRPDSGDPVDIICGLNYVESEIRHGRLVGNYSTTQVDLDSVPVAKVDNEYFRIKGEYPSFEAGKKVSEAEVKGVIELLWDTFGGTINEQGYKVLDSHIGAIYGDSITLDRAVQICERLKAKGFASTNIVLGIGSYTYQYNTRDTFGFAMKATYGELTHEDGTVEPREIFKDPITDDGTKRSKKGLLQVCYDGSMETYTRLGKPEDGTMKPIIVKDQQSWEQESKGLLKTIFKDGQLVKRTTLEEIRERINSTL